MKKYFVVDEAIHSGDTFTKRFDTLEAANKEADMQWYHLTDSEKRKRHIFAAWVTPDMLTDVDDWNSYHSMGFDTNCFDSKTWYAYLTDAEDNDWGTGSFILADVVKMWKERYEYQPDARIAVIDDGIDPICREYLYANDIDAL